MPKPTSPFEALKRLAQAKQAKGHPFIRTPASHEDGTFVARGPKAASRAWHAAGADAVHHETGPFRAAAAFEPNTGSGALGHAAAEYRAHRAAIRGLKSAGVSDATVAAYRNDMTPDYTRARHAAVKGLLGDLRAGRDVPADAEKFLRKTFESTDAYVARRLRRLHARLDAVLTYLSEPARGADGQFKTGAAITAKNVRAAYAPHAGKEILRKAVAAKLGAKSKPASRTFTRRDARAVLLAARIRNSK